MARPWLITGGCGFIGLNLLDRLAATGTPVRVLDNLCVGSRDDLRTVGPFAELAVPLPEFVAAGDRPPVQLVVGDIRDRKLLAAALDGVDTVVHLAAQTGVIPSIEDPAGDLDVNVTGLHGVLMAARDAGVRRFVFTSSNAPLGDQEPPLHEGLAPRPLSPYGASKAAGEAFCHAFYGSFGLGTVVLRFANAYGPHAFKKGSVIAAAFKRALAGESLVIYGDGEQTRDFVHAGDLAQAIMAGAAAGDDAVGEIFHIASGVETSIGELIHRIAAIVERDLGRKVEVLHQPARKGEVTRSVSDIRKARERLGYAPEHDLEGGLEDVWRWFRKAWKGGAGAGAQTAE